MESVRQASQYFASFPDVELLIPYSEGQTMLNGNYSSPLGTVMKGVPENIYLEDKGFSDKLKITDGVFDITGNNIVLGQDIADNLGVMPGETVTVLGYRAVR